MSNSSKNNSDTDSGALFIDKLATGVVHAGGGEAGEGLGVAGPAVQGHLPSGPLWSKRAGASSDDISVICGNTAGLTEQGDKR